MDPKRVIRGSFAKGNNETESYNIKTQIKSLQQKGSCDILIFFSPHPSGPKNELSVICLKNEKVRFPP